MPINIFMDKDAPMIAIIMIVMKNLGVYDEPKDIIVVPIIMFHNTYFTTWICFIMLQESFRVEFLADPPESRPLVPQEMSSILHRE